MYSNCIQTIVIAKTKQKYFIRQWNFLIWISYFEWQFFPSIPSSFILKTHWRLNYFNEAFLTNFVYSDVDHFQHTKSGNLSPWRFYIQKLTSRRISYFICGDFNAKNGNWNIANRAGTLLYDVYNRSNFATTTHFPTDPHKTPSTIDWFLTNDTHEYSYPSCIIMSSDHYC